MVNVLIALAIAVAVIVLTVVGWLAIGVAMVIGTAWFAPNRLRTPLGGFRLEVAVALLIIWPIPAFLGVLRVITWPARRLTEKRASKIEPDNVSSLSERSRAA